jgi:hypothetical protein
MVRLYRESNDIRTWVGMLDALALLPLAELDAGMAFIRNNAPDALAELIDYFDATYVSGPFRPVVAGQQPGAVRLRRMPPLFRREMWNVHLQTLEGEDRTNNICEGWNNAFQSLVGQHHPAFFAALIALRQDCAVVETLLLQHHQGHPIIGAPRNRQNQRHKERLRLMCTRVSQGEVDVEQFLATVGEMIRF